MTRKRLFINLDRELGAIFPFIWLETSSAIQLRISCFNLAKNWCSTCLSLIRKVNYWEGVVGVRFTLRRDKHRKELGIAKSSGYPLLDEAALSAVKKPVPTPPFSSAKQALAALISCRSRIPPPDVAISCLPK